ncbi:mediator of DNA damage checkpoint protein 1 [Pristis pectinata]|uniref:mediator of DNA damage checkpoint protein 1 n=1 Tax=Pristis pectinata TaxID=685728 RepID=UPI00223D788C|nr:mediator of DNA damage checkpoint protein 1 [Pristis pectinata]
MCREESFTSGSDPGKPLGQGEGVPGAGSSKEEKDTQPLVTEATDTAAPLRGRPSEPCEQERGGPEVEERWANEETQPFCTHEGAVEEEERAGEPEEAPASLGEVNPGDHSTLGPAGSPQRTGGGSRAEPAAEVREGGSQTLPEHGGRASLGEAAGHDAEESSRAAGRVGKRRGRAKPRAAGSDPSAGRQEEAPVPGAGSGEEPSREARPSRRKSQQPGREEGAETPTAEETPTRPKRGRGRQKSSSQSATTADDHLCPPDQSPQDPPQRKGRRRSVAAPQEVTPQTESPPQQQPTGRGRRTQECTQPSSQEAELSLGRLRRSRAVSQPDSGKETTPQQIKTRRQACQLSPSSSSASLPESLTLPKVMFTGLVDEDGMKVIMQLGGEVVECVHDSTHLVTDRIRRTVKFLCAVARGIPVVTPEWLRKSGKNSYFLSPRSFLLDDRDQEQNFNFKLKDSLQKAKEQPLLRDYRIHVTAGVQPDPSQMGTILRCSGATVLPKMPRAYKEKTLVISCPGDLPKCKAARDAGIPVVNAEFILTGILQQTVDVVKYRLDGDEVVDSKPEGKGRKRASAAAASTQPAAAKKKKKR